MKVVVTGGSGFIGSHVVDRLIDGGHDVVVVDQRPPHRSDATYRAVDIGDLDGLRELIMKERRPPHHDRVRFAYSDAYLEPLVIKTLVARSADALDERPNVFVTLLAIGFLIVHVWGGHGADLDAVMTQAGTRPDERSWSGLRLPATWSGRRSPVWETTPSTRSPRRSRRGVTTRPVWGSAMRRAASASGLPLQERSGSETQPDVGSRLVSRLVSQTVLVARLLPARDSRCSSSRAATL